VLATAQETPLKKLSVRELDLENRRVFVRVDFNVPLDSAGGVADDTRLSACLPTLRYLQERGARLLLASHLGRPKGKRVESLSLVPVARRLETLLGTPVRMAHDCVGPEVVAASQSLQPGGTILLENLRFHAEETANEDAFGRQLAESADLYVNDAFGSSHRAHASVVGVPGHVSQAAAGFLMEREIEALGGLLGDSVVRPYVAVLGGAKVTDKVPLVDRLLGRVDRVIIGGAMAYSFLRARGVETGASKVEEEGVAAAAAILDKASGKSTEIALPCDHVQTASLEEGTPWEVSSGEAVREGWLGVDIGPRTVEAFSGALAGAGTVLWNGPVGLFERPPFDRGTREVAEAMIDSGAFTVVGGGDTAAAVRRFDLASRFDHVSTGGGASLEFLSRGELPGLTALTDI
jgi:phosphoglycerate kinase